MKNILLCFLCICSLCTPVAGVLTADFGISAIISIVTAAIAAATAIGTGTASAIKADEAELKADIGKAKNDSFFNKEYYADSITKKENRDVLNELSKRFGDDAKSQAATSGVLGVSPDTARQLQAQGNEAYSNAVSDIKAGDSNFKKSLLDNYTAKDDMYSQQKAQAASQKANALASIFTGVSFGGMPNVADVAPQSDTNTTDTTSNLDTTTKK